MDNKDVKPQIIGLCGLKGSGKDTAASFLLEEGWARISFADPLKDLTASVFGMKPAKFHHPEFKDLVFKDTLILDQDHADNLIAELELGSQAAQLVYELVDGKEINTARELLQFIGTDVIREILGTHYWVDRAETLLKRWLDDGVNVVFTDVRFKNERDLIKDYGGNVYVLLRDASKKKVDEHSSEVIDFIVDGVIKNDDGIEELGNNIKERVAPTIH